MSIYHGCSRSQIDEINEGAKDWKKNEIVFGGQGNALGDFLSQMLSGTFSGVTGVTNLTTNGVQVDGKNLKMVQDPNFVKVLNKEEYSRPGIHIQKLSKSSQIHINSTIFFEVESKTVESPASQG